MDKPNKVLPEHALQLLLRSVAGSESNPERQALTAAIHEIQRLRRLEKDVQLWAWTTSPEARESFEQDLYDSVGEMPEDFGNKP